MTREQSFLELASAVRAEGHELFEINGDYTAQTIADLREYVAGKANAIFEGSLNMRELVLKDVENLQAFGTAEHYACSRYYWRFGNLVFNDQYAIVPLGDIHRNPVVAHLSRASTIFIRPDSAEKQFQAGPLELRDAISFQARHSSPDLLVVVSTPKTITGEWRFVCSREGEIVAMSSYRIESRAVREGKAPLGAVELCKRVLAEGYLPDALFVVDVCADADGAFWLLELNPFTGAGLYACDKLAIVRAVARLAGSASI